ncbi:DUF342 domain-containing protein [Aliidiomarina celeris]|uniref:DUF342 domain-containing protein n=1 Tax=Aliidiomarina celeris TaxID=2249428 RepID=UPI000DEB99D3|nr:FapA family protein [Aliidiomarina celeris]
MGAIAFKLYNNELKLDIPRETPESSLTPHFLESGFLSSRYKHCKVDENAWKTAAERFVKMRDESDLSIISVRVGEQLDGLIHFRVSDDQMEAEATAQAPYGGKPLSTQTVLNQLREHKIVNGIRRAAIEKLVLHTNEAEPGETFSIVIAKGKEPVHGKDTEFKPLVEDARKRVLKPQAKDKHRVDMRNLGELGSVQKGTQILERIPPTLAKPGFRVTGEILHGEDGVDIPLQPGPGTEISSVNNNILVATLVGLPSFTANTATVDQTLSMGSVDVTTGHINYEGSVIIDGNVASGMEVIASGDITVHGYIDSAIVRASGNITVTKGVIGHMRPVEDSQIADIHENSARITADGSIYVAYAQYATLVARDGILVDKQLTHCHVISAGKVHIGGEAEAANGKIIGGLTEIADDLFVGQLGAPAGTRTRVMFSVPFDFEANELRQQEVKQQLQKLLLDKKELARTKEMYIADPASFSKGFKAELVEAITTHQTDIISLRNQLTLLQQEPLEHPRIRAVTNKVLHFGAEFLFRDKIKFFDQARGPTQISIEEGQIKVE